MSPLDQPVLADPEPVTAEENFWEFAHQVAFYVGDSWLAYERLKRQYVFLRPDASPAEYEAAMKRLATLLKV